MKPLKIFIIGLISFSCNAEIIDGEEDYDTWKNPEIGYSISEHESPIKQFPYDPNLTNSERIDSLGLVDFFARMKIRFNNSGFLTSEANEIYTIIFDSGLVSDGSYGMPSPDYQPAELTFDDIKSRVSILKVNNTKCEVLYWNIGCGRNFSYIMLEFDENSNEIINIEILESWSASYPC
ncbi:MAG: hypothetical protein KAT68_08275 [Bacteroidales bacterium]|nr:hypothetical protein [Bacteroidales bacterium]